MHETWKHIKFQQILNRIKENQYISGRHIVVKVEVIVKQFSKSEVSIVGNFGQELRLEQLELGL